MTETVIITGQNLDVDHQAETKPNPKRKRPPEYTPPPAGRDIAELVGTNPFWSAEANDYADTHPQERPKDLAHKLRHHRIEPT